MKRKYIAGLLGIIISSASCQNPSHTQQQKTKETTFVALDSASFASTIEDKTAQLYTISNKQGAKAYLTNFGARLVGLIVPDKNDELIDVVLGFDKAQDYHNPEEPFFGTIVGPFGNRIAKGTFAINGKTYKTAINNGPNTLHGGFKGVHFAMWDAKQEGQQVVFTYTLPDLQEGFPGNTHMQVTYSLDENNTLTISYQANTDKETVINLTNHAYFNLNGEGSGTILNHQLQIFAQHYTPVDSTLIPTGEIASVKNTAFDFTRVKTIGQNIEENNQQLGFGNGYDHNFVLDGTKAEEASLNYAAKLQGDISGIVMDIYTEEPGIQFYSGNFMSDKVVLKNGATDSFRTALCLEPQHFPDSPNQLSFPSVRLKPGETYKTKSVYKFSTSDLQ